MKVESDISSPLKIGSMIFTSLAGAGGYPIFTYQLLTRLAQRGHQVDLYITHREYRKRRGFYRKMPFSVRPLPFRTHNLLRFAPFALRAYLAYQNAVRRYDVWQIVGSYPAGYVASSLSGRVPLVLRTHGEDIQKDAALNYGLRLDARIERIIKGTVHKMDRLVALSESIAECYRELGVTDGKIVEIPNGVDVERFKGGLDGKVKTRQKWGLPMDRPLVLTVGRNHPKKGYAIIPEVARILKANGASFLWLVVGDNTDQLDPLIERSGVAEVVRTQGEIGVADSDDHTHQLRIPSDGIVGLYQCADIFAFPTLLEGFPRVLIEAMAAGLPMVTTDAPGCKEVVSHEDTGLVAQSGNVEEFASHLYRLLQDGGLRERLKDNANRHVRRYDWEVVTRSYEELYRSLLPQGR